MKHTKSRNGFTLIELIIVMVILGIMAAVAVPRYLDSISNAEEAAELRFSWQFRSWMLLPILRLTTKSGWKCSKSSAIACLKLSKSTMMFIHD